MCFCCYFVMSYLKLCKDFSTPYLRTFQVLKRKKSPVLEDEKRVDSSQP